MADRPKIIASHEFGQALADAGVIDNIDTCRRIVIDANGHDAVLIYVERLGDERLLKVTQTLEGVQISGIPAPENSDGD